MLPATKGICQASAKKWRNHTRVIVHRAPRQQVDHPKYCRSSSQSSLLLAACVPCRICRYGGEPLRAGTPMLGARVGSQ
jgi:hypothetical protein